MLPPIYELLLQTKRALATVVHPKLRAVMVDIKSQKKELLFFFYYDGEITENLSDIVSVAMAEIDMNPPEYTINDSIIRLDSPQKIPVQGKLAFLRYEPELPEFKKENRAFLLKQTLPIVVLQLDTQEALLGKVTPALRHVSVGIDIDRKELIFSIIYDGPISQLDSELAVKIIEESSVSFPKYKIISYIERTDYPNRFSGKGTRGVYSRLEET